MDFEKSSSSYESYEGNENYLTCKIKLDNIFDRRVESPRIRSKCNWYKNVEKSTKFFLSLEKRHAIQNQIKILVVYDEVVKDQIEINKNLNSFYRNGFSKNNDVSRQNLSRRQKPKLNED